GAPGGTGLAQGHRRAASTLMLLRTIRLDRSDTFVFTKAAEPGEWAVPGSFLFWRTDPAGLAGKEQAAFRSGFLGITSFVWSTLAVTAEASEAELAEATGCLARQLETRLGAPSAAAAMAAAAEELAFARSLARHAPGTLIAL